MRAAQGQQQMMQGQQMERSNSQMDMNGPRSGSPGSGDAPSPKRQRMDGNVQQMGPRPGQQGQMPNTQRRRCDSAAERTSIRRIMARVVCGGRRRTRLPGSVVEVAGGVQ